MTEKLLTGTLSLNTNKQTKSTRDSLECVHIETTMTTQYSSSSHDSSQGVNSSTTHCQTELSQDVNSTTTHCKTPNVTSIQDGCEQIPSASSSQSFLGAGRATEATARMEELQLQLSMLKI